ncbi:MAG: LPS-assembly protein LptD [Treponema sp.]|nr:LPS-assembly protein LptD [Treponema sp.]
MKAAIRKELFTFLLIFFLINSPLFPQEEAALAEDVMEAMDEIEEALMLSRQERNRIEMELKTSTLSELAAWCRMLGLSESGTRAELVKKIGDHYNMPEQAQQNNENRKVITIESAQTSEYFTIEVINEDYARLKGDVRISLKDKDAVHNITADEILFNRTRNLLTANGNITYEKKEADSIETFRGKSLTVNIDNWSSIFLDGNSTFEDSGAAYLFSGSVIYRSEQEVTILNKARISNANTDEAYWSIRASKLWLLPGSDFAIFNAVLNVGEIPVLYIPFFYFPTDEIVFHPVLGYRSREGGFIQTTTYIFGRPKSDNSQASSLSKILGNSNDNEKELQGLFLRSTSKKAVNKDEISLKAMLDYYVNLGAYAGIDLLTPKKGILNPIDFSLGLGFSRTVSNTTTGYTPYAVNNYDGTFDWNQSNLFSALVPFRYKMKFNSGISGKYGSLTWSIPFYSDPFMDNDFGIRAESMDWMNMIQQGGSIDPNTSSTNELGPFQWQLNGNLNPSLPKLDPYISKISISTINTSLSFIKLGVDLTASGINKDSPNRFFYAPDKFTMYHISASITGTPVTIGMTSQQNANKTSSAQADYDPFNGIGVPISPWPEDQETSSEKTASGDVLIPPVITQNFSIPSAGNTKFSFDYQLTPTASSELNFMFQDWKTYEDVDWSDVKSILSNFGINASLNFRYDHTGGMFSNTFTFTGSGNLRDYTYLNEDLYIDPITGIPDKDAIEKEKRSQYDRTNYNSTYAYNGTFKPLYQNSIFSQSNLQYSFRGTLVRSKKYVDGDGPELTPEWGSWAKEDRTKDVLGLSSHRLSANLTANVFDKSQSITLSTELPPMDGLVTASATFRAWITETNLNFRMEKPETEPDWILKPYDIRETFNFGKIGSFVQYIVITPEENNRITSLRSTLSLWKFRSEFIMVNTPMYKFEQKNEGTDPWGQVGEAVLNPKELFFGYKDSFANIKLFKNRLTLSFNIDTSLTFDLQKYTNSIFNFSIGLNLKINNFLDINLSALSKNSEIWRYFEGVPWTEDLPYHLFNDQQKNIFTDLFNSFNFFNESKRKESGFKMHRFNLDVNHHLGDWSARLTVSTYPYPDMTQAIPKYRIISDVSFVVQWTPISEIKSEIKYEGKYDKMVVK